MANDLLKLFAKYKYDKSIETKSKTWFQQQITLLSKKAVMPGTLFRQEKLTASVLPGSMYMFYYDPKHKETLPYYDRFPLVLPYQKDGEGFTGLNLHYLPNYYRVQLLHRLMQFANSQTLDEKTKIRYSWSLISGASKFKLAQPCIKRYLKDHVQSAFINVKPADWHTAMMLPTERFVGANKIDVWGDNRKWVR